MKEIIKVYFRDRECEKTQGFSSKEFVWNGISNDIKDYLSVVAYNESGEQIRSRCHFVYSHLIKEQTIIFQNVEFSVSIT